MQFESLKVFCDLAETESFTKTAQINGVSQSAVSQTISALEKHFKSLLIERSKKNFRLTSEGEVLYQLQQRAPPDLRRHPQQATGDQSTSSPATFAWRPSIAIGLHDLPPYVKRFMKDHPEVNIHVEYRRANQVYEGVLGNIVDLGLVAYPVPDPKLEIVPLRKDPLVLACHPQHPFAKLKHGQAQGAERAESHQL